LDQFLAVFGSWGHQVLQKTEEPTEQTLCFSMVPLAIAVALFGLRAFRQRSPSPRFD
jgi:hypothetical protein